MTPTLSAREGKIRFNSPSHALEVQSALLANGYRFAHGEQAPRKCFGVMFRGREIRSAGTFQAWKAYGAQEVEAFDPYTPRTAAQEQGAYAASFWKGQQTAAIQAVEMAANEVLLLPEIMNFYPVIFTKNKVKPNRKEVWDLFVTKIMEKTGAVRVGTMRRGIVAALSGRGEKFSLPDWNWFAEKIKTWNNLQKLTETIAK